MSFSKKMRFLQLGLASVVTVQHLHAGSFSVDQATSSGPGSLNDVIKAVNALFPGEGESHKIYIRTPLVITEKLPILRQNIDFSVQENQLLSFQAPIESTASFTKSGPGLCIVNGQLDFKGPWVIREGTLQIENLASPPETWISSGTIMLYNPSTIGFGVLECKDQGTLVIKQPGVLGIELKVDQNSFINTQNGVVESRMLTGSGNLNKIGEGELSLVNFQNFTGNLNIKKGSIRIPKGSSQGTIFCEEGEIYLSAEDPIQHYQLNLAVGQIHCEKPSFQFLRPVNLIGSDASIHLDKAHINLRQGFKGWGVLDIYGPGELIVNQQEALCAHLNLHQVQLETNGLAPRSVYTFDNSKLKFNQSCTIDARTDLVIEKSRLEINHGSHSLNIFGRIKGSGALDVIGKGLVVLNSVEKVQGTWNQIDGTLDLKSEVTNLKIGKNAQLFGTVRAKDFEMNGVWHYKINSENSQTISEAREARLLGTIVIEPDKGDYTKTDFRILNSNALIARNVRAIAPAQFDGTMVLDSSGLYYRVNQFHDLKELVKLNQADDLMLATQLNQMFAAPGSDIDNAIRNLVNLRYQPQKFLAALGGLQPAYFSALGLVQESNFILARSSLSNRMQELISFPCAKQYVFDQDYAFWFDPVGDFTEQQPRQQDMGYHASSVGGYFGFDGRVYEDMRIGGSLGYTNSQVEWMESVGKGFINSVYSSLYFLYKPNHFYVNGSIAGAYSHYDASRNIQLIESELKASHKKHGLGYSCDLELGYVIPGRTATQPYFRGSYINLYQNPFEETGAGDLNLKVDQKRFSLYRLEGGFIFNRCLDQKNWTVTPEISLSGIYEQEINSGQFEATYVNTQETLVVNGMKPRRLLFSPGAALDFCIKKYPLMIGARYHAELCPQFYDQRISGHLAYSF